MRIFIGILTLSLIVSSCFQYRVSNNTKYMSKVLSQPHLTIINGTGIDLKLYTKKCYIDNSCDEIFSYLWFFNLSKTDIFFQSDLNYMEVIAINYNDSSDTIFKQNWKNSEIGKNKIILGDQNIENKIVLLNCIEDSITALYEASQIGFKDNYAYIYSTNHWNKIYYAKVFDINHNLIAKSPLIYDYVFNNTKPKKRISYEKVGMWKYYNNDSIFKTDTIKFDNIENLIYPD